MFCENCGSRIPDGAKYCTECGIRVAAPTVSKTTDDTLRPASSMWSVPSQGAAPNEAAPVIAQSAAASEPDGSGWSIPGGIPSSAPLRTEAPAAKPLYKRWWFWLILIVGIGLFALLLFAALIVLSLRNTMPPSDDIPAELEEILTDTAALNDIDQIPDILESSFGISVSDDAFPLDADDQYTPMDILLDRIEQSMAETGMEYDVWADEDDWVFVDVWFDGLDDLAGAAYEGDEDSLAQWQEQTERIRAMSEEYLADLLAGGQHDAVCVVSLLDDTDTGVSLAIAIDGELILDLPAGLDEYDLLEE